MGVCEEDIHSSLKSYKPAVFAGVKDTFSSLGKLLGIFRNILLTGFLPGISTFSNIANLPNGRGGGIFF